ncbi:MAG: DMT family transporter [Bacteroidota bacterium]|nr:DMT family transporter [Bacteroidota bacterium]
MIPLKRSNLPVYLYAITAMLFWGISFIWTSILLKYYQPVTIIFIRLIFSSLFLFFIIFITKKWEKIARKDWIFFVISAFFNPFLYFLCENYGVKYSTSTVASVIIATIPLFSPLAAFLFFREKLTWMNFAGIIISFGGIWLMLLAMGMSMEMNGENRGILILFGAVMSSLIYSLFLRRLTKNYSPVTIIAWQNLIGIFLFLPLFFILEYRRFIEVPINSEIVYSFLFLSILCSSLAFVFYTKTIQVLGISKANIFSNLIPVFTAIFSFFMLSERFTWIKILGIAIVIAGLYLSQRNHNREIN